MRTLEMNEVQEVSGGGAAVVVVVVIAVVGLVGAFAVGVYNGYKEAEAADKAPASESSK